MFLHDLDAAVILLRASRMIDETYRLETSGCLLQLNTGTRLGIVNSTDTAFAVALCP